MPFSFTSFVILATGYQRCFIHRCADPGMRLQSEPTLSEAQLSTYSSKEIKHLRLRHGIFSQLCWNTKLCDKANIVCCSLELFPKLNVWYSLTTFTTDLYSIKDVKDWSTPEVNIVEMCCCVVV